MPWAWAMPHMMAGVTAAPRWTWSSVSGVWGSSLGRGMLLGDRLRLAECSSGADARIAGEDEHQGLHRVDRARPRVGHRHRLSVSAVWPGWAVRAVPVDRLPAGIAGWDRGGAISRAGARATASQGSGRRGSRDAYVGRPAWRRLLPSRCIAVPTNRALLPGLRG